jgi:dipeptidyl aminopeptidase/acylaminoacyl peptidase
VTVTLSIMLNLDQLLRVPRIDPLFDISPDGSKLAFAWNKTGEWQIYEMELEGNFSSPQRSQSALSFFPPAPNAGAGSENSVVSVAKPLTTGPGGKFNPRYSPDGTKLAYALDPNGSESYHLVLCDPSTNTHTDLTPDISHALQPNFSWSPDGCQLAFLSDEKGHFSAYVIPSNGGDTHLVLDIGHPAWQVEWSPSGRHLAVSCEMHGQDYGIFIVDLETKEVIELPLNAHEPRWSPDGEKLAFHSDNHGWFDVGVYDLGTKEIEWITRCEGDSQTPIFMESNSLLLTTQAQASNIQIAYTHSKGAVNWMEFVGRAFSLTTTGGLETRPTGMKKHQVGQGIHSGIRITSDAKRMVTTFSRPSQPPDLWMIDLESGEPIQLTNSLPEELSDEEFVIPEEIEYPGMDGTPIPALLYGAKRTHAPAVVMIHGGPNWHYSTEWNPIMAHLASRGYVVLAPNYRGSTGYGREWQYAAQFDMGGVDTRDVAAGAQYLLREGIASKVAVTGRSHGGYLTMTCLTQFPELWCAGSAVVPFTNWFKSHEDAREDLQHWNVENMGDPGKNHERWYNASPFFFLDKIQAPVQLICGGVDPRCPASDSIATRDKLLALGKSVDFLLYEDEGHAFLKIENVLDAETKRMEFLMKALEKKE